MMEIKKAWKESIKNKYDEMIAKGFKPDKAIHKLEKEYLCNIKQIVK